MSDLVAFLRACIADESRDVLSVAADADPEDQGIWVEFSDAESRVVDLHTGPHRCPGNADHAFPTDGRYIGCDTLRLLAFERRDDPRFRQEWLPEDLPRVLRTGPNADFIDGL